MIVNTERQKGQVVLFRSSSTTTTTPPSSSTSSTLKEISRRVFFFLLLRSFLPKDYKWLALNRGSVLVFLLDNTAFFAFRSTVYEISYSLTLLKTHPRRIAHQHRPYIESRL